MNYEPLYTFAEKHRVPYNELCTALRAALAAPQPEPEKRIVWCTETDSACSTCPTLRIPCQAATQAAALNARVTVPREPTQEMIAAGEAVFRSYCFRHVNGAIPTYEAMIAAVPAPAAREPQDERAAFEAWHSEYRGLVPLRRDDSYFDTHARLRWEGWQARAHGIGGGGK